MLATPGNYSTDVPRLDGAPVIDGKLDDAAWQKARLLSDFVQLEPENGKPATEKTEVRVGYDAHNIYFGVRCFDDEPLKAVAGSMRLDADLTNDDSITIVLDTFLDKRNGFLFSMNPIGAKTDALLRNEGEEINTDWNGLWEGIARRDDKGWTAEIAIPFRTLRFSAGSAQVWGFNVRRLVARKEEQSFWRPMRRDWGNQSAWHVSSYGELTGMTEISPGGRYQLTPYGLMRHDEPAFRGDDTIIRAGGDLKINLTSDLVADLTVRTDFAEVEADQQQINLDRFKLFYPEKREFFLEGANLFYFGDRIEPFAVPEQFIFFFSRQIGLAQDGQVEVPVLGGAKLSGRVGKHTSLGLLNITTGDETFTDTLGQRVEEPQTNYTVARVRQEIYPRSSVGLIGLNKEPQGDGYNRGAGFDWDLAFGDHLYSAGWLTRTFTPGVEDRDSAYSADLVYQGETTRVRHRYTNIGDNFNPEMGFVTRTGIIKQATNIFSIQTFDKTPFKVHKVFMIYDLNHIDDQHGNLQTQLTTYELGLQGKSLAGVAFLYYDDLEDLQAPLPIDKHLVVPPGHYRFRSLFTGITSGYSRRVGFTFWYHKGGYYGGDRLRTLLSLVLRPTDGLFITPSYDRVEVNTPYGDFVSTIAQVAAEYSLSPTLTTRLILQRRLGDNFRANFLIDWTYRPGSDLYLVYNDTDDLDLDRRATGLSPLRPGRSIILKATRRFDF